MTLLTLNLREWKALETVAARTTDVHILRRAQALLWLDEGETVPEVAARLRVTRQAVYKWVACFRRGAARWTWLLALSQESAVAVLASCMGLLIL
jgi:Homeodomain-like domain